MTRKLPSPTELLEELLVMPPPDRIRRLDGVPNADQVLVELGDEAHRLAVADVARALEASAMLNTLSDSIGASRSRNRSRRARAYALSHAGRFDEALAECREAIRIAEEAGLEVEAARARMVSMQALAELGMLEHAIEAGERARSSFLRAEEPELAGKVGINIAIVHLRRDDPRRTLATLDDARALLVDEPLMIGHIDNSRGEALYALSEFRAARGAFESALRIFEQEHTRLNAAIAEGNLADLAAREGRLQDALYHFERTRRLLESDVAAANLARVIAEQAEAMAVLGMPAESISEYERALPQLDQCGLTQQAARARAGMGLALVRLGRLAEAATCFAAAAKSFEELGHQTFRARVDLMRADLSRRNGQLAEARRLVHGALAVLHEHPVDATMARLLLGETALDEGDLDTAAAELQAGLALARRIDIAPLLADLLHACGRLELERQHPAAARAHLEAAIRQVERVRGSLQAERFRTAFMGNRVAVYEDLARALVQHDDDRTDELFFVAEQARNRTLLDQLAAGINAGMAEGPPSELRLDDEIRQLQSELNALYSRLADEQLSGAHGVHQQAWRDAMHEREERLVSLESRRQTTRDHAGVWASPCRLDELHAVLPNDAALVEFFAVGDEMMMFFITSDGASVHPCLCSVAAIREALRRFRFQLQRAMRPGDSARADDPRLLADARRELGRLHDMLLAPARERIERVTRLHVVPYGPLHTCPMHALWDGQRHLVERFEVRIMPSASVLAHRLGDSAARPTAFSPVVVGVSDEHAPHIASEARLVADLLGAPTSSRLVEQQATVERFRESAEQASVLHLACHGRFDAISPFASGLKLADRWLSVRDILGMKLRASLITVSGCETGLAAVQRGDEVIGLLRSFLAAGAGSLLLSLWRVNDESALNLMASFYESWKNRTASPDSQEGDRAAAALRHAQLAAMKVAPHPAIWAPFTLVG